MAKWVHTHPTMKNTVPIAVSDECSRLFAQALRGDADAATQLYARCVPPLAGWLAQRSYDLAAQEMAHEAMVLAFRKGHHFKPGHSFQVWLRTLAWHRALNTLRHESRRRAREQAYLQLEQVRAAESAEDALGSGVKQEGMECAGGGEADADEAIGAGWRVVDGLEPRGIHRAERTAVYPVADPSTVPLFAKSDMLLQGHKLMAALALVVNGLTKPETVIPVAQAMARRRSTSSRTASSIRGPREVLTRMASGRWPGKASSG